MYPCPCCGYLVFKEAPGSYANCPICSWEDDSSQLKFPDHGGGANRESLVEAQANYELFGASNQQRMPGVRPPAPRERRDQGWRRIDLPRDYPVEIPRKVWPADDTALYWWRPTFWLREPVLVIRYS
ncbi:CPCC family cysteine-rich protein [Rathayibacter sp. CAU 1779]